jgi:SAM-dependent methyltransferase
MTESFGNPLDKENAVKRSLADFPKAKIAKLLSGNFLLPFFEERAAHVEAAPFGKPWNSLDRLLRSGLYSEAFRRKDHKRLRAFLSNYWGNEAKNFHEFTQDRFERMFLNHDVAVIEALEEQMKSSSYEQLYEIGCGGGQVIEYLCIRLTSLRQFTGIDLGEDQIVQNRKHYDHAKLAFETADATEWLPKHALANSIFLTNGGVLEYFLQDDLEVLFSHIGSHRKPAAVVVIETIGSDHDLETEQDSLIYGREMSFSHNYPHLLRQAGFEIVHQSDRPGYEIDGGGRWLRVLATANSAHD